MPKESIDITPEDSVVPVFLEEPTDEELLNVKQNTKHKKKQKQNVKQFANPLKQNFLHLV
jgi:hypothetical protein